MKRSVLVLLSVLVVQVSTGLPGDAWAGKAAKIEHHYLVVPGDRIQGAHVKLRYETPGFQRPRPPGHAGISEYCTLAAECRFCDDGEEEELYSECLDDFLSCASSGGDNDCNDLIEMLDFEYDPPLSSLDSLSLTCADRAQATHSLTGLGLAEGGMWGDQSAIEIRSTLSSSQSLPADRLCLATDHPGGYSGSMTLEQVPPDDSRRKAAFAARAKNNWAALNESLEVSG